MKGNSLKHLLLSPNDSFVAGEMITLFPLQRLASYIVREILENKLDGTNDTLRDVQISIFLKLFQIQNRYIQLIAFLNLVSKSRP